MAQAVATKQLLQISVRGVVQGVGFRPFIYQLAQKHDLKGWVCNTSGDVKIEVEGKSADLARFLTDLKENHPPQSRINELSVTEHPAVGYKQFEIRPSLAQAG